MECGSSRFVPCLRRRAKTDVSLSMLPVRGLGSSMESSRKKASISLDELRETSVFSVMAQELRSTGCMSAKDCRVSELTWNKKSEVANKLPGLTAGNDSGRQVLSPFRGPFWLRGASAVNKWKAVFATGFLRTPIISSRTHEFYLVR